MNRRTRVLVLLIAASLAGTAIVATQFVRSSATMTMTVNTNLAFVQLMASDRSPTTANAFVLRCVAVGACTASGSYQLTIGTWAVGQDKVFTAAFALVSTEVAIDLTLISMAMTAECPAAACPVDVYAHADPAGSCSGLSGITADATDCETYITNGVAVAPSALWVLERGCGAYDTTGSDDLQYGDNDLTAADCGAEAAGGMCESTWNVANGVWVSNLAGGASCTAANNIATNGESNHVWIELVLQGTASGAAWTPTLSLILSGGGGP